MFYRILIANNSYELQNNVNEFLEVYNDKDWTLLGGPFCVTNFGKSVWYQALERK